MKKQMLQHLQNYQLGMDKGFAFEVDPRRIFIDGDQSFYNYILKCFVLIDLHIGDPTQQSPEKMQGCENYYVHEAIKNSDNRPIGILLCVDKNDVVVKYILPDGNSKLVDSRYVEVVPSEEGFKILMN